MLVCFISASITPLLSFYPYELTGPILVCSILLSISISTYLLFEIIKKSDVNSNNKKTILELPIVILAIIWGFTVFQNQYNIWGIYIINMILLYILLKNLVRDSVFKSKDISNLVLCTFIFEGIKQALFYTFDLGGYSFANNNILSMAIVIALPFIYQKSNLRIGHIIAIHIFFTVLIFLLQSRTGLIGMLVVFLSILYIRNRDPFKLDMGTKIFISMFLFIGTVGFMSLNSDKKESTDGRVIIWKNSIEIIKDQSIFGSGLGSFKKQIAVQFTKYFSTERPETEKDNFTSQINIAYNDGIQLFIECGVLGLLFYAALVAQVFQNFGHLAIPIFSFIIMGITNSVFYIVPCGYILIMSLVIIDKSIMSFTISKRIILISLFFLGIFSTYTTLKYEKAIRTTKSVTNDINAKTNLQRLKPFTKILNSSDYYWLMVANNFYKVGNRKNATMAAAKAVNTSNDYRAFDLLASIANKEGSQNEEKYLKNAHYIVPGLVIPKYNLFQYYKENCKSDQADFWANEVLNHKNKGSRDITYFKDQVNNYLENEK